MRSLSSLKANVRLKVCSDRATRSSSSRLYLSTLISTLSLSVIFVGVVSHIIMSLRVLWLQFGTLLCFYTHIKHLVVNWLRTNKETCNLDVQFKPPLYTAHFDQ